MDLPRPCFAALAAAVFAAGVTAPALAQTSAAQSQAPSDLEMRFKEGVQELGDGAQKVAAAIEASATDFWAAGKAAFEAGSQTWQARRDARLQAAPATPRHAPPY